MYLNEDWAVEYSTWQEATDAFVDGSPDEAPLLVGEIETPLAEHTSEAELAAFFEDQGGAYLPRPEDGGYRGLLTKIAERVSERLRGAERT